MTPQEFKLLCEEYVERYPESAIRVAPNENGEMNIYSHWDKMWKEDNISYDNSKSEILIDSEKKRLMKFISMVKKARENGNQAQIAMYSSRIKTIKYNIEKTKRECALVCEFWKVNWK